MAKLRKAEQYQKFHAFITGKDDYKPQRVRPAVKSNQKESEVLNEISEWLDGLKKYEAYKDSKVERLLPGEYYTKWGGTVRISENGASDLLFMLNSKEYRIECKSGNGGKLSKDQIKYREQCKNRGVPYLVFCSLDECKSYFDPILEKIAHASWEDFIKDNNNNG